ncbi:hypothetical protein GYA93_00870 [Gordonia desulfuricans]|uniref:DUF4878 domain-containing protein n=1 Tax=Gordonia desulfuricans TaxID=89051 RepID=A0A7K3LIU8_9ACTN|nr:MULTISPECIES: hypothetical protein [Gordonia]KOY50063.1 hypothetical protein ISGA_06110 [Gordonia sp. NB41Y]NDK88140.1 hypothetical protein [Gordonia desulfuricans]WLP89183.1 hypothetical protein Q9K23_16455 [Gordonia sp. NB41Y]
MAKGARRSSAPEPTDPQPDDAPPPSWRNAWPFLVALVVVALAALGIGLSYLFRPAEERASDAAKVQYAINDQYTARNNVDYAAYRESTCAAELASTGFPSEQTFTTENQASLEANGRVIIPEITDVSVDGDRATAKVHWQFDKKSDQTHTVDTVVVREDGNWKVCKA